jgi:hypothetical protein
MKFLNFIKELFGFKKPTSLAPPFPKPRRKPAAKKTAIKVPKKKASQ